MIKGVKATTVQEDLDIVVREVKNCQKKIELKKLSIELELS